ncbi:MAG: transposase, partial [Bradyrhizobiaceae bacterium]|nr:transposase [Bradyrhizobiaceae bacterium]
VVYVDPRGTSQECPECDQVGAVPKTLKDRWHCCDCGAEMDRDVASAKVVHYRAFGFRAGTGGQNCSAPRRLRPLPWGVKLGGCVMACLRSRRLKATAVHLLFARGRGQHQATASCKPGQSVTCPSPAGNVPGTGLWYRLCATAAPAPAVRGAEDCAPGGSDAVIDGRPRVICLGRSRCRTGLAGIQLPGLFVQRILPRRTADRNCDLRCQRRSHRQRPPLCGSPRRCRVQGDGRRAWRSAA